MKTKNIKIGIVAALVENKSIDRIQLEQRLKELAQIEYKGKLMMGALCYRQCALKHQKYVCSHCGNTIQKVFQDWMYRDINLIEKNVNKIRKMGYDVVLDKRKFCPNCSKKEIQNPKLLFKIRYSPQADYHIVKSNIIYEYQCLLAFLSNKKKFKGEQGWEFALHDNIPIIQKMTGLGKDLKIEKQ